MKCWKTMPMPAPIASAGEENDSSRPSTSIVPESGFWTPYRIFISVDLPAPFSPTRACTVPRRTVTLTWSFAMTPGNRLPMSVRRTAMSWASLVSLTNPPVADGAWAGPGSNATASAPGPGSGRCLLARRDLDGAVDDLLLVVVQLGLDVVDLATARGVVDAALLEVERHRPGQRVAVDDRLDEVVDRDVDVLDHRGHDDRLQVGRRRQVLVGVDADGQALGGLRGLEHTEAGAAGSVEDHVGAAVELALGSGLALARVVEAGEVRRLGEVGRLDLDVRVGRLGAGVEAGLELVDQRRVDATDEADRAGLRLERGRGADEEGALLLGEDQV